MRQLRSIPFFFAALCAATTAAAQPAFLNGLTIAGDTIDATHVPGANAGRFGQFSDLYFDPVRQEWWALSDRGPGGGLLDYAVRVQRIEIVLHPTTSQMVKLKVKETVMLADPDGLLAPPAAAVGDPGALNGLNPLLLNGNAAALGRSFDPEGLVVDPSTGHLIVADEYGPSIYEFSRTGRLIGIFETPTMLLPKPIGTLDFVAGREGSASGSGRQDNRGYEGLAISPDGSRLFAVLQDPLLDEGPRGNASDATDNDGRDGRNVRIVVFDNVPASPTYRRHVAQYVYPLEAQAAIRARILAAGGTATGSDPRQGRNIGLSAIVAINDHRFLVLERDNRGIGVDNPAGRGPAGGPIPVLGVVGSKRVYAIDLDGATDVSAMVLPDDGNLAAAGIVPVQKNDANVFIDLAATTLLPNANQAEKWEGLAIGPKLPGGGRLIVAGNDNDYSVTQTGSGEQFDVYVDFAGHVARCVLDDRTRCEVNPAADDLVVDHPVALPAGFSPLPGMLHAYRASAADLAGYVAPSGRR
ncbi:MAG: esterase-like activity of phytase family protein [Vicinamibacteraceae bacterium]